MNKFLLLSAVVFWTLGCNTFGEVDAVPADNQNSQTNNQTTTNNQTIVTNNANTNGSGYGVWQGRCPDTLSIDEFVSFDQNVDGTSDSFTMAWSRNQGSLVYMNEDAGQLMPLTISDRRLVAGSISEELGNSFVSVAKVFDRDGGLQTATIPTACSDGTAAYFGSTALKLAMCGQLLTDVGFLGGFNVVSDRFESPSNYTAVRPNEFLVIDSQLNVSTILLEFSLGPKLVSSHGDSVLVWNNEINGWYLFDPISSEGHDVSTTNPDVDLLYIGKDSLSTVYALVDGGTLTRLERTGSEMQPYDIDASLPDDAVSSLTPVPGGFVVGYATSTGVGWRLIQITNGGGFYYRTGDDQEVSGDAPTDVQVGVVYEDGCDATVVVLGVAKVGAELEFTGGVWPVPTFFSN